MKFRRFSAFFLALLLAVLCVLSVGAVAEGCTQETNVTTILFTHDLHSHFLPQSTAEGGESGGYARLKTVIDGERAMNPDALLVDGGDFSIGSLIQTLYTTQAAELRTMGAMGYDAVTIGNHEFDHKGVGFAEMLNSAKAAQQAAVELLLVDARPLEDMDAYRERFGPVTPVLPTLLEANYAPADDNPDRAFIRSAMENYGVTDCMTLERGGVTYGLFGLMGGDSDECAPTSGFTRTDAAKAAKRCVETLKGEGAEIIVCLSHSGTGDSLASSEDEELAKAVDGIDVIISGHTHFNTNVCFNDSLMEHNTAAVCGTWWRADINVDGTPRGYGIYEVNGDQLKWIYKSAGYPLEHQFHAYPAGSSDEYPSDIIANVWNWDDLWKVEWYENGQRMGEMQKYKGYDPMAKAICSDKEKVKYDWISPVLTEHLFHATPHDPNARIEIKVTDRFGNVYTQTIENK